MGEPGRLDRAILAAAADPPASVLVFRGRSKDPSVRWGFDPDMSPADFAELGYALLCAQLPVYRRLMCMGVRLNVHVEWGLEEVHVMKDAVERRAAELEDLRTETEEEAAVAAVDAWILRNMTFYFALPFERVMDNVLPDKVPLLERQADRMESLTRNLPAAAIA